jgi:hypothetical protein
MKTMIQTAAENAHKKRKQSDNESDQDAQEYKSRKKNRETTVIEAQPIRRNASTRDQYYWL